MLKNKLELGAIYTTLFLGMDTVAGYLISKKPLHEVLGLHLPQIANTLEYVVTGASVFYGWAHISYQNIKEGKKKLEQIREEKAKDYKIFLTKRDNSENSSSEKGR